MSPFFFFRILGLPFCEYVCTHAFGWVGGVGFVYVECFCCGVAVA